MKITNRQLRKIIREAIKDSSQAAFPPVSHPIISQYANKLGYKIKADRPDSWFVEYQNYDYDAGGGNPQGITLYYLPDGKYFARINGSYGNTLSNDRSAGHHDDPIDAIEAALNSSPSGSPPFAKELLTNVGDKVKPSGISTWPD